MSRAELVEYTIRKTEGEFDILKMEFEVPKNFSLKNILYILELIEAMVFAGKLGKHVANEVFNHYIKK